MAQPFRRAKSGVLGYAFIRAPGPECAKFTSGAVQFLRLGLPTNAPGANPASPQTFPLGGRWLAEGQTDEGAFPIKPSPFKGEGAPEGGG